MQRDNKKKRSEAPGWLQGVLEKHAAFVLKHADLRAAQCRSTRGRRGITSGGGGRERSRVSDLWAPYKMRRSSSGENYKILKLGRGEKTERSDKTVMWCLRVCLQEGVSSLWDCVRALVFVCVLSCLDNGKTDIMMNQSQ